MRRWSHSSGIRRGSRSSVLGSSTPGSRTVCERDGNAAYACRAGGSVTGRQQTENPARPSAFVAGVFDAEVFAAELCGTADEALLYPAERAFCARYAPKRIAEFTAGRLCARRALGDLGVTAFPIAVNPDRSPRWPAGVVGSISHTEDYACAVVAVESVCAGIGVDTEMVGRVTADLDALLFTAREREFLASLGAADRARAATIVFSAKEAFYKGQYAVTHQWLDFQDVSLELTTPDMRNGTFRIDADTDRLALERTVAAPLWGRFRIDGERVITGVMLRARRN